MQDKQNINSWDSFIEATRDGVQNGFYEFQEINDSIQDKAKQNEIFLFVNFDICNFTKYKREHPNWLDLLRKFINVCINHSSNFLMQFWKFNGDSITYKVKIQSIDEICLYIKRTLHLLTKIQSEINSEEAKRVYVKAGIWISEFPVNKSLWVNNVSIENSKFGKEYVGENIDEGFRLCSCSKADILVVDPKIVYIINLCDDLLTNSQHSHILLNVDEGLRNKLLEKINFLSSHNNEKLDKFAQNIHDTNQNLYFAEFQKCKGVWDDRDYPIFWYIERIENKLFSYDEVVNKKMLMEHDIYRLSLSPQNEENQRNINNWFQDKKNTLMRICSQNESSKTIYNLIENLKLVPDSPISGKYVFDKANLYYMIACVLRQNNQDLGVLIFKRGDKRKHLQNVWDLVPIKHARLQSQKEYLKQMLIQHLSINKIADTLSLEINIESDEVRHSVKPYALCNIYRNGDMHNGILCVAELNILSNPVDGFIEAIRKAINENGYYTDVSLVSLDDIDGKYINMHNSLKIRSLEPEEVEMDSIGAANDEHHISNFSIDDECQYGVSYISYSVKQVLKSRRNER